MCAHDQCMCTLCLSNSLCALVGSRTFVCMSVCRPPAAFDHAALALGLGSVRRRLSYTHAACCKLSVVPPCCILAPALRMLRGMVRCVCLAPHSAALHASRVRRQPSGLGRAGDLLRETDGREHRADGGGHQEGPVPYARHTYRQIDISMSMQRDRSTCYAATRASSGASAALSRIIGSTAFFGTRVTPALGLAGLALTWVGP